MRVAKAAGQPIVPPSTVPLEPEDMGFFASVIAEFARSEWTAHQLELAAMLARTMADMEREQRFLREEGSVMQSERGTPVVNPRKSVVQMNAGTIFSFRRSLALHARGVAGENRNEAARKVQAKELEATVIAAGSLNADDLLARRS